MKELTQGLRGLAPRRRNAGYTQERFAEALGVTRSLLAAWEVGVTWPSSRWLPKMAELLGCEVDDLYRAFSNAECGMRNAEFTNAECGMRNAELSPAGGLDPSACGTSPFRGGNVEGGGSDGAEV